MITGQARTSGAVAGDGLPELRQGAPGLLSNLLSDAKTGPINRDLSYDSN